ncbi:MAG: hypothetical protein ACFFBD_27760 [Candidatus Hodarchaeota archaeon]
MVPRNKVNNSTITGSEPEDNESRERRKFAILIFGVLGFLVCPCSFPILAFLLSGTTLGVFLLTNSLLITTSVVISFILVLLGLRMIWYRFSSSIICKLKRPEHLTNEINQSGS